jgi:hypothetical protein
VADYNPNNASETCKVFISYSWDSDDHKTWALDFANRLRDDGIDAVIDQTHLGLGGRTPQFMEQSVTGSRYVLVICTEKYKARFDSRQGGAGYEGHIITGELINQVGINKFIPVLRKGGWDTAIPIALSGVFGVDLRNDSTEEYQRLLRHLHGLTELRPIGNKPDWLGTSQSSPLVITPPAYGEQLKALADTAIIKKIWSKPRWRIWSRPEEFKKARFRDLEDCARFVASANVRSNSRWSDYPLFPPVLEYQDESIANEVDRTEGSIKHLERWVLFRSAQFVHNMALDRVLQLGERQTHVLEILDITTAAFEFIGRMADRQIFSGRVAISFEFQDVEGRQLTWPQDVTYSVDGVSANAWCQDESFTIDKLFAANDLRENRRSLAMDMIIEIYLRFGWNDPPRVAFESLQSQRFGPPRRS